MAELIAMEELAGKRDPFIQLDSTGWSEDSFTLK